MDEQLLFEVEYKTNQVQICSLTRYQKKSEFVYQVIFALHRFSELKEIQYEETVYNDFFFVDSKNQLLTPLYAQLTIYQSSIFEQNTKSTHKKSPICAAIPLDTNMLTFNEDLALSKFDELYHVDTNERRLGDDKVFCCMPFKINFNDEEFSLNAVPMDQIQGGPLLVGPFNKIEKHEQYSYAQFIHEWKKRNRIHRPPNFRVGIIGDKNTNDNFQLLVNLRQKPIVDNIYLEKPFELIYISSNKKKKHRLNSLFQKCDSEAKRFFQAHFQKEETKAKIVNSFKLM